jgi:catechol 2,3-dioxygenase-like lactoylglutathione lyase family enzyme
METEELHRGRLIDHIQLVVRDLAASRRFYEAVFQSLGVPLGGTGDTYFWFDELFISSADSEAAQGKLTGRHHIAFQARDRAMVHAITHNVSIKTETLYYNLEDDSLTLARAGDQVIYRFENDGWISRVGVNVRF